MPSGHKRAKQAGTSDAVAIANPTPTGCISSPALRSITIKTENPINMESSIHRQPSIFASLPVAVRVVPTDCHENRPQQTIKAGQGACAVVVAFKRCHQKGVLPKSSRKHIFVIASWMMIGCNFELNNPHFYNLLLRWGPMLPNRGTVANAL